MMSKSDTIITKQIDKQFTKEELAEFGRRSIDENRTKKTNKKSFKMSLDYILNLPAFRINPDVNNLIAMMPEGALTVYDEMALTQVFKVLKDNDTKAFMAVRDTVGQGPNMIANLQTEKNLSIRISVLDEPVDEASSDDASDELPGQLSISDIVEKEEP